MTKSLLLITDPIDDGYSVQFELIKSMVPYLQSYFKVSIYSTYLAKNKVELLKKQNVGIIESKNNYKINRILSIFNKKNESMLWVESWFRESFFKKNSKESKTLPNFDFVVKMSSTIPIKCDMWWIQGPTLYDTLESIAKNNNTIKIALFLTKRIIKKKDKKLSNELKSKANKMVTNAKHLKVFYTDRGFTITDVIYSPKNFAKFSPQPKDKNQDYVLVYIGKETDFEPIKILTEKGVKIIGFGSKVPLGISINKIKNIIEYKGYVTDEELVNLYSNALFTAFPFTDEPFGYIPIESMLCGTPVLSYNKQGPAETILNEKTGWLVSTQSEFVVKGLEIWTKKSTGIAVQDCINRAKEFSSAASVEKIKMLLES